jgi:hypothetical protein
MRILYCLLMTVLSVVVINQFHGIGDDWAATLLCFGLLAWLLMLGEAIYRTGVPVADWIIRRAMRTPYVHLAGYMERYWFFRFGRLGGGQSGPYPLFGSRVHHILRSDEGRDFHDHPWPYLTIILRGGYWEVTPDFFDGQVIGETRRWHGPGSVLLRGARSWHRLELPEGATAWTLFCTGPKVQHWGFLTAKGKIYWREYLGVPAGVGED